MGLQTWHEAGGGDPVLHSFAEAVVWTMYDGEEDDEDAENLACVLWDLIESVHLLTPAALVDALPLSNFLELAHCVHRYELSGGPVLPVCHDILADVKTRKGWGGRVYESPDFYKTP